MKESPYRLGPSDANAWTVSDGEVDLIRPAPPPRRCRMAARRQNVTVDLHRSALLVIDMQNDFCAHGGWMDALGVDLGPVRRAIAPIAALLPALRAAGVPIVWLNWGNRPDRANLPPWLLRAGNPTGAGFGYGDEAPSGRGRILERGSWGAEVVEELAIAPGDVRVDKYRFSGFHDNELDGVLRNRAITTLLFAGTNTEVCVLATLMDAAFHGYDCILVEDACSTPAPATDTATVVRLVRELYGFTTTSTDVLEALRSP